MRFSLFFLLSFVLLAHAAFAQQSVLNQVCSGVSNLSGCRAKLTVPNGVKVVTKRKAYKKFNKCKTKKTVRYNCGTKKKPKKCTKRVCQKGYNTVYKNAPSSLKISYKKVDLCGTIRKVLGTNLWNKFLRSKNAVCGCLPKLRKLGNGGKFTSISTRGDLTRANADILDQTTSLQTCVSDAGFQLKHNYDATVSKLRGGGWTVARGEPVDSSTYKAMIAVFVPCRSGSCNPTQIRTTFTTYLNKAYNSMAGPLDDLLSGWQNSVTFIQRFIYDVDTGSGALESSQSYVSSNFDFYRDNICNNYNWCTNEGILQYLDDVSDLLNVVFDIGQSQPELPPLTSKLSDYDTRIKELKDRVRAFPSATDLVNAIRTGRFNTVKDIINLIPIATELPTFAEDAQTGFEAMYDYAINYGDYAYVAQESLERLVSIDFETEFPDAFDGSPDSDSALAELNSIRDMLKDDLLSDLSTF